MGSVYRSNWLNRYAISIINRTNRLYGFVFFTNSSRPYPGTLRTHSGRWKYALSSLLPDSLDASACLSFDESSGFFSCEHIDRPFLLHYKAYSNHVTDRKSGIHFPHLRSRSGSKWKAVHFLRPHIVEIRTVPADCSQYR